MVKQVKSIEDAIRTVILEDTECQLEWYELGKTNDELNQYLGKIDYQKLGVFVGGELSAPFAGKLLFMPDSWVKHDNDPFHSIGSHQ